MGIDADAFFGVNESRRLYLGAKWLPYILWLQGKGAAAALLAAYRTRRGAGPGPRKEAP